MIGKLSEHAECPQWPRLVRCNYEETTSEEDEWQRHYSSNRSNANSRFSSGKSTSTNDYNFTQYYHQTTRLIREINEQEE